MGFSEGIVMAPTETFLEDWIRSWMPAQALLPYFVIERAHRSLARRPPAGAPPRPLIANILNHRDRDSILRQDRELGEVTHDKCKIMIFPDYKKARRSYEAVKL